MLNELLNQIENHYSQMKGCMSTSGRAYHGKLIISIFENHPQVYDYWDYLPNEFLWENRFRKNNKIYQLGYKIVNGVVVDPITNLQNAPTHGGIYLIGQTNFNPYTDEKQYWVKVGASYNIWKRFKGGYTTTSPCTALIATSESNEEVYCQGILATKAIGKCQQNQEWWLVDRKTYLEICERKFEYFGL
jgi:hypothetical protein